MEGMAASIRRVWFWSVGCTHVSIHGVLRSIHVTRSNTVSTMAHACNRSSTPSTSLRFCKDFKVMCKLKVQVHVLKCDQVHKCAVTIQSFTDITAR